MRFISDESNGTAWFELSYADDDRLEYDDFLMKLYIMKNVCFMNASKTCPDLLLDFSYICINYRDSGFIKFSYMMAGQLIDHHFHYSSTYDTINIGVHIFSCLTNPIVVLWDCHRRCSDTVVC